MFRYLLAMAIILLIMLGWVAVQFLARAYAARHPEFGPAREEGSGCGAHCRCSDTTTCTNDRDTVGR
jgi:hypothetical protein